MDSQGKRRRKAADSSLTRTFPSTGGPAYDEALLTLLHGHGARFVLVADRETKRPVKGCNWLHGKPISFSGRERPTSTHVCFRVGRAYFFCLEEPCDRKNDLALPMQRLQRRHGH